MWQNDGEGGARQVLRLSGPAREIGMARLALVQSGSLATLGLVAWILYGLVPAGGGMWPQTANELLSVITLAALSGNVVTETIMASLRQAVVGYVHEAVGALADWDAVRRRLQDEHRGILAAVDARDGELAAASLREHILGFYALATGDLAD